MHGLSTFLDTMLYLFPSGIRELVRVLCWCFVTMTISGIILAIVHAFKELKGLFRLG